MHIKFNYIFDLDKKGKNQTIQNNEVLELSDFSDDED